MNVRHAMFVLGVFGCRVAQPTEVAAPELPPTKVAVHHAPVERRAAEPPVAPSLPPPAQVTPIEHPFARDAVIVEPVLDQPPVVLFSDETEAIRKRVAARLAVLGIAAVPYAELARIESAAAVGRLVLEGDRSCRSPLSPHEVSQRYFPDARTASPVTSCVDDDCALEVFLETPADPDTSTTLRSRAVVRPFEPRSWAKAADSLADRGMTAGMIGLSGFGSSHPPPIMFGTPEPFGPWAKPPDARAFDTIGGRVNACAHADPHVGFTWDIRVSVGTGGRITRCRASSEHSQARARDGECICGFVETIRYANGRPGRRFRIDAIDEGGFRPDERAFRPIQARTEVWVTRINEAPALAVCEARGAAPIAKGTTAILDLAPDGSITGVQIHGAITTTESIAWAECLTEELPRIALPCRPPGVEQLHLAYGPP